MSITLFDEKNKCCGCGSCLNTCTQDAIFMQADEFGFVYPKIDDAKCIECGACKKVCGYQIGVQDSDPIKCYAAIAKDMSILKNSSSGGIFAVIATNVLKQGGVVYGAAIIKSEDGFETRHIRVDSVEQLYKLQGSKYVQSTINYTFEQVKHDLILNTRVLFSGTPCQIAGLRAYLGREYDGLLTIDIVCHGVPSGRLFQDFIKTLESRERRKVAQFAFRYKDKGRIKNVAIQYQTQAGLTKYIVKRGNKYSYTYFFMKAFIQRESCYNCPFATHSRISDITLGDYWGFYEEHPYAENKIFNISNGISCVLINTEIGKLAFEKSRPHMHVLETTFEKIAKHNEQLKQPCSKQPLQKELLKCYREQGYEGIEEYYRKKCIKVRIINEIREMIPLGTKRFIMRMRGKRFVKKSIK